ncbi:MAG TPA: hypothetical protein VGP63_07950 [Planctomycetaceae bacterium]|jgi:hypothetical protein|nr:hypothetical protein [Planctomycetaceae bacterium]
MDVFCPHCLQSVTLEGRDPGDYSFDCPECAGEVLVSIPRNASERPQVRPVRSKPAGDVSPDRSREERSQKSESAPRKERSSPSRESFGTFREESKSASRPRPRARDRDAIDFPFEASDENLVDAGKAELPPLEDEWEAPEYQVAQPLRGQVIRKRTAPPKRRKKSQPGPEFSTYLKWMGVGAAAWLVLAGVAIFVPEGGWAFIVLGVMTLFVSRGMVLRLAKKEGHFVWLACLMIPLYSLFFVISHFRQTVSALIIAAFGYGYLISGGAVLVWHEIVNNAQAAALAPDEDDPEEAADRLAPDTLTLKVNGKETPIHVDSLTYFEIKPRNRAGAGGAAGSFEFAGADLSLRGTFPAGFRGNWDSLIGKVLTISPRSDRPQPGDSQIKLPGRGLVKVTGGKVAVSVVGVVVEGKRPQQELGGAVELDIAGPGPPETIQGGFLVHVKSEH